MEDFLIENYNFLTKSVEIIAAVTGLLVYKKFKDTAARYFIFFLVYIVVLELVGGYIRYVRPDKILDFLIGTLIEKNFWLYTLCWKIGAILFFNFYYIKIIENEWFKSVLKYAGFSYLGFSIVYIIFNWEDFFQISFPVFNAIGAILVLTCSVFYLVELLHSDKVLVFYNSLNFYISIVIFIWWLITTPLTFYSLYYGSVDISKPFRHPEFFGDINYITLQKLIYLFSNTFMYLTYTFALLWCRPEKN
ncbi:MAG: hypothetical protein ABJM36_08840 [Algibacter sp.]|uniref:hypothetical protein n=1 Tax=Algibacter sp. TaxID=1872428 RepID=UPI0032979C22